MTPSQAASATCSSMLALAAASSLLLPAFGAGQEAPAQAPATFEERLAQASAFQPVAFHPAVETHAPFTIFAQRKLKEPFDPAIAADKAWGKWLKHLHARLDAEVVTRLGREPREGHQQSPLLVLASQGDYINYLNRARPLGRFTRDISVYDEELGCAVTFKGAGVSFWRTYPILHDLVMARLASVSDAPLAELWVLDGLATFYSYHRGPGPEAIDKALPHRSYLESLENMWKAPETFERFWIHPRELLAIRGEAGLRSFSRTNAATGKSLDVASSTALRYVFEIESWLLVHWAMTGEGGKRREAFLAYVDQALDGRGGAELFTETMGLADLDELDRKLLAHALQLHQAEFPDRVVDLATPPLATLDTATAAAGGGDESRELSVAAARSSLGSGPVGYEERLAFALWLAREGRLTEATVLLEGETTIDSSPARVRFIRGKRRIQALHAARESVFREVAAEGARLRLIPSEGTERTSLRVEAYEDGVLTFGANKAELHSRAAEEIPAGDWVRSLGNRLENYGPSWLRGYALALIGDKKARRYLEATDDETAQVRADTEANLHELLALGEALGTLADLSSRRTPRGERTSSRWVEIVAALMSASGDSELVARHAPALRTCTREALAILYVSSGLSEQLNGELEQLGEGRIRLTYGFDDEDEQRDFVADHRYRHEEHERIAQGPDPDTIWFIEESTFGGTGWVCYRHLLEFEAPLAVKATAWAEEIPDGHTYAPELMIGVCDDGRQNFVGLANLGGSLYVFDEVSRTVHVGQSEAVTLTLDHALELRHDGQTATAFHDGEERDKAPTGPLSSGAVFLWSHSYSPLFLRDLVIEGRPTPASLEQLGQAWVTERLEEIGL